MTDELRWHGRRGREDARVGDEQPFTSCASPNPLTTDRFGSVPMRIVPCGWYDDSSGSLACNGRSSMARIVATARDLDQRVVRQHHPRRAPAAK